MTVFSLEQVLHPQSIAVVGASDSGSGSGFLSSLIDFNFKGEIYPVNPKYTKVMGLEAYPTVRDIPRQVDYVISAAPAAQVPRILMDCVDKGVKGIHLFTARFSETGRQDAIDLEREVIRLTKESGIRVIGPNCVNHH